MSEIREFGKVMVLEMIEDVGLDALDHFRELMTEAENRSTRIVLDLSRVGYMNSQAIGLMSSMKRRLGRQPAGDLRIANPSPRIRELLQVTRLDKIILVYPTVEEAVASFETK